jgi:hypothetical protein
MITFPAAATVPFTVVTINAAIDSTLNSLSTYRNIVSILDKRSDKAITHYSPGSITVTIRTDADQPVVVLVMDPAAASAHAFGVDNNCSRRHVFVSGAEAVEINEVFGQDDDEEDCVVCLSETKSVILMPCLHMCVCISCNRMIDRCPVCRASIQRFLSQGPGIPLASQLQPNLRSSTSDVHAVTLI